MPLLAASTPYASYELGRNCTSSRVSGHIYMQNAFQAWASLVCLDIRMLNMSVDSNCGDLKALHLKAG